MSKSKSATAEKEAPSKKEAPKEEAPGVGLQTTNPNYQYGNPVTVSGNPAKFHDELTGRFDGTNVSGTVLGSVEYVRDGQSLSCTSGQRPWAASLQG